jgi:hypothetical protein
MGEAVAYGEFLLLVVPQVEEVTMVLDQEGNVFSNVQNVGEIP